MAADTPPSWHSNFNLPGLVEHASQLRNVRCSCNLSQRPISGSLNWVIFLSFEDGVEWGFRSPTISEHDLSLELAGELLECEVATMKYIKFNTSIPVPDIFDYSCSSSNVVGIPFILMSKAHGTQLQDFRWDPHPQEKGMSPSKQRPHLNNTQKEKIMRQLGVVTSQLLNLRFNKIGSLFEEAEEYRVGKCFCPAFIFHERDTLGDDIDRGPFQDNNGYYEAMLSAFILHVQDLRLQHNVFFAPVPVLKEFETSQERKSASRRWQDFVKVGTKIDSGKNRIDYCTAALFLRRMIPFLSGESFAALEGNGFPLYHADLSTSNIFVDRDLNITCIIDWAFASTVPISTLLTTPGLPHPRDDTDPTLERAFRAGFVDSHFQGNHTEMADLWEHAHRARLFTRLVMLDGLQDYYYFKSLYTSVFKPDGEVNIWSLFKSAQKEDDLGEFVKDLEDDEEWAHEAFEWEEEYFERVGLIDRPTEDPHEIKLIGVERRAVARKITAVSELSQNFVADARLWRWIEQMMRDLSSVSDATERSW